MSQLLLSSALLLILAVFSVSCLKSYDGYKIIRLTPENKDHIKFLVGLEEKQNVYFIEGPIPAVGYSSEILLAPEEVDSVQQLVKTAGIRWEELVTDVQKIRDLETVNTEPIKERLLWDRYYPLADIYDFIETQADSHSLYVSTSVIGFTYEGREMKIIKISKSNETKPAIWIDSLIHSREWITGAVGTYLLDQLLNNSNDTEIQNWIDNYDFYYLPVFNADGYDYTHTTDRVWRKTRSPNVNSTCFGTDANRNFDYAWMQNGGASDNPCSNTFAGSRPFSELETANVRNFINSISGRLVFYLSLHSAGQYILIPYGDSPARIPQYNTYMRIGQAAAEAHAQRNNTIFTTGNVVDLMYIASGISMDWAKFTHNPALALTYELRDKGEYGHLLPADQIYDSAVEFFAGFRVLMRELIAGIPPIDP